MSRLIAFGCSITYGLELPDCMGQSDNLKPSDYAWPSLLAKKLNKDVINLSGLDTSNQEILCKLLDYKFEPNDFCAIYWTYYNRIDQVRLNTKIGGISRFKLSEDKKRWKTDKQYHRHNAIENFLIIHHASLYLEKINIPYYFLDRKMLLTNTKPNWVKIPNYDNNNVDNFFKIDYANDNLHPGIDSHIKISNYFYNKIHELR